MAVRPCIEYTRVLAFGIAVSALASAAAGQAPMPAQAPTAGEIQTAAAKKAADEAAIRKLPECSLAKTNDDCKLIIDRDRPLTPPAIQMYSNKTFTVIVSNPKTFERYFLDFQSGQAALTPDVASSIVQGLLPSLAKVGEFHGHSLLESKNSAADLCGTSEITNAAMPAAGTVNDVVTAVFGCIAQLSTKATGIYRDLEPFVAPDSLVPMRSSRAGASLIKRGLTRLRNVYPHF